MKLFDGKRSLLHSSWRCFGFEARSVSDALDILVVGNCEFEFCVRGSGVNFDVRAL